MSLTELLSRRNIYIHHLVLLTFVGPRPEGMEVRHLDGDPLNNTLLFPPTARPPRILMIPSVTVIIILRSLMSVEYALSVDYIKLVLNNSLCVKRTIW